MKVSDVMTSTPLFCRLETNLGAATELLWNGNCGFLPVVGEGGRLVGTITDRDICIALGTRHQLPGQITVAEVAPNTPISCGPDDDLRAALAIMRARKVHRLAV